MSFAAHIRMQGKAVGPGDPLQPGVRTVPGEAFGLDQEIVLGSWLVAETFFGILATKQHADRASLR